MKAFTRRLILRAAFAAMGSVCIARIARGARIARRAQRRADLVITALQWSDDYGLTWHNESVPAHSNVLFRAVVKNSGKAAWPPNHAIRVDFRANSELVAWSNSHLAGLSPGGSTTLVADGSPAGDYLWNEVSPGSYSILAQVDPGQVLLEANESNNTRSAALTVDPPSSRAPDLVVTGLRWSEDDGATWHTGPIQAGSNVWFEADVGNQGTGPTPEGVIIGVGFRANGTLVSWSDDYTQSLPAGQTVSLRANGGPDGDKYWNNAPAGSYTLNGRVDGPNRIIESNEENNDLNVLVTVGIAEGEADLSWVGINTGTGFRTATSYVNDALNHCLTLGMGFIRHGIDKVGGRSIGNSFNFSTQDNVIDTFMDNGVAVHAIIGPQFHVNKDGSVANWLANWKNFCEMVFAHYFNRPNQVLYYCVDNEPDLRFNSDPDYTPQFIVDATKIAFNAAKAISPSIIIEGPPCANPGTQYQLDMLNAGLTNFCDVKGMHSYGDQMTDVYHTNIRVQRAWLHMASANANFGHPFRPIVDRERGTSINWAPDGLDGREYQARSFAQSWMQHKRWGLSGSCLFSLSAQGGVQWDIASSNVAGQDIDILQQPTHDRVRNAFVKRSLQNGGFELPNDRETEWVIAYAVEQTKPFEWTKISFVTGDPTNARTGNGYCRMDMSGNAPSINGTTVKTPVYNTRIARRVVEFLTPGQEYTITAYTKITGGGTATLKALGYNKTRGDEEQSASTTVTGSYQQLQVTVTPTNPWVVISLEGSGTGAGRLIFWDDVSIALTPVG